MKLEDLFVSHKLVKPVKFSAPVNTDYNTPLYSDIDRVKSAISLPPIDYNFENMDVDEPPTWNISEYPSYFSVTTQTNPYRGNRQLWISDITAAYRNAGLSDNAIKNLIAKNALESRWGSAVLGNYNYGNITAGSNWSGAVYNGRDKDANGNPVSRRFRSYTNMNEFVQDELALLRRLYDFNPNDDFDTFIGKLQGNNSGKYRYAEARDYIDNVRRIYDEL